MKTETKKLTTAIASLLRIPSTRMSLPILTCVRMESDGVTLTLAASNLDEHQVEFVGSDETLGAICVNLNHLSYSVGAGEETSLTRDGGFLAANPQGAQLGISDAEEFPASPDETKMEAIAVNCSDLADCIMAVQWARAVGGERFALEPIHAVGSPKSLYVEATDGRRVAWMQKNVISVDFEILVMGQFCANFCNALRRTGAVLFRNERLLLVRHDAGTYACKIPEIQYPNTETVKLQKKDEIGRVPIAELADVLKMGLHLSSGRVIQSAKFEFGPKGLRVSFNDPKHSVKMDVTLDGKFKKAIAGLDIRYALEALTAFDLIGQTSIRVWMIDELSPVKFEAGELSVITMPVRLT